MLHKFKSKKIKQTLARVLLATIVLFSLSSFNLHKEYYSLTKIVFNESENTLQITMRLFTDDMELAIEKHFNKQSELGSRIEVSEANQLVENYINQKFTLAIDGKIQSLNFLGKEYEKDAMYVYFEILNINNLKSLEVQSTLLQEVFPEQENIIKININNQHKSLILTKINDKGLLNF